MRNLLGDVLHHLMEILTSSLLGFFLLAAITIAEFLAMGVFMTSVATHW